MTNSGNPIPLGFTSKELSGSYHVCLIYENEKQRQKIVSEYLAAGIRHGELVRYFTDKTNPETIRSWLLELGVELTEAEQKEAFAILQTDRAYYPTGQFKPQVAIDNAINRYDIAEKAGFKGSRVCGEMSWALKDVPGSERIMEYEVLLNSVNHPFPHTGMCQYDARLFDGVTLLKVLQVHPYIIAQGQIVQNPYYIKPEEYTENR